MSARCSVRVITRAAPALWLAPRAAWLCLLDAVTLRPTRHLQSTRPPGHLALSWQVSFLRAAGGEDSSKRTVQEPWRRARRRGPEAKARKKAHWPLKEKALLHLRSSDPEVLEFFNMKTGMNSI